MNAKDGEAPKIDWVKNDPTKHRVFADGSRFLVALRCGSEEAGYQWEFATVSVQCDEDEFTLLEPGGDTYDAWNWEDFEYFALLDGEMPSQE
jgi:hypothetical protein